MNPCRTNPGLVVLTERNTEQKTFHPVEFKLVDRGVAIFAERFFRASQQEKIGKNYATAYAYGAPIRPRHLVPTQQGVGT